MAAHFGWSTSAFPCPDFYGVVSSARYYNTTPWDMLEQSTYWQEIAVISSKGEASAQKVIAEHNKA